MYTFYMKYAAFLITCIFINCSFPPVKLEKAPQNRAKFMEPRTVRIIVEGREVREKFRGKWKELGWGTGTILYSSDEFSLVQTANHVLFDPKKRGLINVEIRFILEKRNLANEIVELYWGAEIAERFVEIDLGLLRIDENLGVHTHLAKKTTIGDPIYTLGYPYVPGMSAPTISYAHGYIASRGIYIPEYGNTIRTVAFQDRGASGSAFYNWRGEIVGIVSMGYGKYGIPYYGAFYGTYAEEMREAYATSRYKEYLLR